MNKYEENPSNLEYLAEGKGCLMGVIIAVVILMLILI